MHLLTHSKHAALAVALSALAEAALFSAVIACGREPGGAGVPPVTTTASADGAKALCTFDARGTGAVHELLAERRAAVQKLPGKLDNWILLGRAWVQLARNDADPGFYLHARACAEVGLALEPENTLSLELLALALGNDHRFVEQRQMAERILAKDPDSLLALGALSDASLELGDVDGAADALQKMLDRKPNLPSYARAAHIAWLKGDVDASVEAWRMAFDAGRGQRDPEPQAWVLTEAANVFWHKGDVDGARAGYEMALSFKRDFAPALIGLARTKMAAKDVDGAIGALNQALASAPVVEAARLLADARRMQGDVVGADEAHRRALALAQKNDKRSYAVLLAMDPASRDDDLDHAQALLDEESARADVLTEDARALVAYRRGDLASAKAHIARATRWGTPDAALWLHKGVIEGDRTQVKKALAMNPHLDAMHVDLARSASLL